MWIDIDLLINDKEKDDGSKWRAVINTKHIMGISPNHYQDRHYIEFQCIGNTLRLDTYSEKATDAIYNAFLIALQGSPVTFDEWGHIKPLLNDQVEALHKRMLYQETIASLANCEGIK